MSSINALSTGQGGITYTADSTGNLILQASGTNIATISPAGLTMNSGNIVQAASAAPA